MDLSENLIESIRQWIIDNNDQESLLLFVSKSDRDELEDWFNTCACGNTIKYESNQLIGVCEDCI